MADIAEQCVLTKDEANKVFDLLVEYGGADPSSGSAFVSRNMTMHCCEFLALPSLGFDGRYWRLDRDVVCTCSGSERKSTYDRIKELNYKLRDIVAPKVIVEVVEDKTVEKKKADKIEIVYPHWLLSTPREWIDQYSQLLEKIGRVCYKSEDKITDDSADKFNRARVKGGHESVIEHCAITVKIVGSRAMSHQLVRHRVHSSYSQESQRYCDYGKADCLKVICPHLCSTGSMLPAGVYEVTLGGVWVKKETMFTVSRTDAPLVNRWLSSVLICYQQYLDDRADGVKPEDARYILPNATKTEIECTFGLRQWRNVFKQRALNPHAQWEIREIFRDILVQFADWLPCIFGDLRDELK